MKSFGCLFLHPTVKINIIQMTVQVLGTAVWRLKGRAKMTAEVRLRSTRH